MSIKKKISLLLAIIFGTVFLLVAGCIVILGIGGAVGYITAEYILDGFWSERLLCSKPSPDGKYNINMYLVDGGAVMTYQLRGELVNNETMTSEYIYYEEGTSNVFCKWLDNEQLLINGYTTNVEGYLRGDYDWVLNRELWNKEYNEAEDVNYNHTLKKILVYKYDIDTDEKGEYLFRLDRDVYNDMEVNAKINLEKDSFEPQYLMELYYKIDGEEDVYTEEIVFAVDDKGADFCVRTVSDYLYRYRKKDIKKFLNFFEDKMADKDNRNG